MARREACATILEDIVLQMQTIMEGDIPVIVVVEAVAGAEANEAADMGETGEILVILVFGILDGGRGRGNTILVFRPPGNLGYSDPHTRDSKLFFSPRRLI